MNNEWDEYAKGWSADASVQEYAEKAYTQLLDVVNPQGMRILDFGCGTGQLSQLLDPVVEQIVAMDASAEMIRYLQQRELAHTKSLLGLLTPDFILQSPDLHKPFDLIIASSVCSFLSNYEDTLALLHSLLKPGGLFVQWDWLIAEGEEEGSASGFSAAQVENALTEQGFSTIELRQPFAMSHQKDGSTIEMPVLMALGSKG